MNDDEEPIGEMHIIDRCLLAWFDAVPDDPYAKCPCGGVDGSGCDMKWRFVARDEKLLVEHEARFVENYKKSNGL